MKSKFYKDFLSAFRKDRLRYYKRQKFFLRPMVIDGELERIPMVSTATIIKLFATKGSKKIYIKDFLNEYSKLSSQMIDRDWSEWEEKSGVTPIPWREDYAVEKDYDVWFKKGDIVLNPFYDPNEKLITIYDDIKKKN